MEPTLETVTTHLSFQSQPKTSTAPRSVAFRYLVFVTLPVVPCVRVIFIGVNAAILDYKLKCVVHQASIATLVVACITVDQLLLRERGQVSCCKIVDAFNGRNGRKGPATSWKITEWSTILVRYNGTPPLRSALHHVDDMSSLKDFMD